MTGVQTCALPILRLILLGKEQEALNSKMIWLCASCQTCSARCPNQIDIAGIMDVLRQTALEGKTRTKEKNISIFHRSFLDSLKYNGRLHELSMIGRYKIFSGQLFADLKLGWQMFRRGKLKIFPESLLPRRGLKKLWGLHKKQRLNQKTMP